MPSDARAVFGAHRQGRFEREDGRGASALVRHRDTSSIDPFPVCARVGCPDPDPLTGKAPRRGPSHDRLAKFWKERGYRGLREAFGYDPSQVVAQSDVVLDGLDSSVRFRSTNLTDLIGEAMLAKVPKARAAIYNCGSNSNR